MAINFSGTYGKVWGAHIVPTAEQVSHGADCWTRLFDEWDWDDWVKPQIDGAHEIGCNTVGIFGCIDGVHATTVSQATVNSRFVQMANYLDGLGMSFYPKMCGFNQLSGTTNSEVAAYVVSILDAITALVEVIGVDIIAEADAWNDGGGTQTQGVADRCNAIYTLVKGDTSLPCTYSTAQEWTGSSCRTWMSKIVDLSCDYLDFHPYAFNGWTTPVAISDANYWMSEYEGRDFIFGEGGTHQTDTALAQAAFCDGLGRFMNSGNSLFRGWVQWAATDQGTADTDKWGIYDASFVARAHLVRTMKKYSQAHIGNRGMSSAGGVPVFGG